MNYLYGGEIWYDRIPLDSYMPDTDRWIGENLDMMATIFITADEEESYFYMVDLEVQYA